MLVASASVGELLDFADGDCPFAARLLAPPAGVAGSPAPAWNAAAAGHGCIVEANNRAGNKNGRLAGENVEADDKTVSPALAG